MKANPSIHELKMKLYTRILTAILIAGAIFFLPAGTLVYWEAWVFLGVWVPSMLLMLRYLIRNDPELLERRMRMREKEEVQKLITKLAAPIMLFTFLLPGFDKRFEWSNVPAVVVLAADVGFLLVYYLMFIVLKENSYASRIIEVEEHQRVITTGPYAHIRHPMYLGALLISVFSPLALGSYWAMIPSLLMPIILIARIRNEEEVLLRELKGYREYMQTTRYRLIPGVW